MIEPQIPRVMKLEEILALSALGFPLTDGGTEAQQRNLLVHTANHRWSWDLKQCTAPQQWAEISQF